MVKAVVHQAQGGEHRFPTGPRALLSWFLSGRKGLGSCIVTVSRNLTSSYILLLICSSSLTKSLNTFVKLFGLLYGNHYQRL